MWKSCLLIGVLAGSVSAQPSVMCPSMPDGAKVVAKDIDGGIELDFRIPTNPTLLRARVHMMESQFNYAPPAGAVPGKAMASDTTDGAKLLVMADAPANTDKLRAQMRERVKDCVSRD